MTPPRPHRLLRLAAVLVALAPAPVRAYVIDANDARVVDEGTFEAELQPAGYRQRLLGGDAREIIAPSMQLALGVAAGWDVLLSTRGFALLDAAPDQAAYSLAEQMLAFRALLRRGAYSDEGAEGPSVVLQAGVLLPGIEAEPGFGTSLALLVSQQWDAGTLHLNGWVNVTRDRSLELFFSSVVEGPPAWPVRPFIEVWLNLAVEGEPTLSGLAGAVIDVTGELAIQAGVRMGGWEGWLEVEARLSAWWCWTLWEPAATASPRR